MSYTPSRVPVIQSLEELRKFVEEELLRLSQSLQTMTTAQLEVQNVEPARPRDGMVAYADGVNWNPGAGAGLYGREAGAWVKL